MTDAILDLERKENNLRKLREQYIKTLTTQIDAGDKESIELLVRLKGGK